jgi:hypothetical protein
MILGVREEYDATNTRGQRKAETSKSKDAYFIEPLALPEQFIILGGHVSHDIRRYLPKFSAYRV